MINKEFEILSLIWGKTIYRLTTKKVGDIGCTLDNATAFTPGEYKYMNDGGIITLTSMHKITPAAHIYSVKRLKDGQIFTIGDVVLSTKYPFYLKEPVGNALLKIEKIELINNQIRFWGKRNNANSTILLQNAKIHGGTEASKPSPELKPINKQKTKGMKVTIKSKKESKRELQAGDIIYNKASDYYAIISSNTSVVTTAKVFIIKIGTTTSSTLQNFKYVDTNLNNCELFEGTITLENEK